MSGASPIGKSKESYRDFYLKSDLKRVKIALLFFILPMAGFAFNDFQFFSLTQTFYFLVALRLAVVVLLIGSAFFTNRIHSYQKFDQLTLFTFAVMAVAGAIINALRPADFIVQAIFTIISIFIVFLITPFKFRYQCIAGFATSIGEALIILLLLNPTPSPALFTVLFGLFVSNLIAAIGAHQLHDYRRNVYDEFVKRKEVQEKLEEHTKHLEELVEERTKRLRDSERLAAIGATAGMVGHDLRNPLTGISNASYFLKKKYRNQLDQQGQEMIEIIESNVQYSNKIITDLLEYSGNVILDTRSLTTPKALVNASIAMINVPSNIKIIDQTQQTPEISVDENKIKRVFINLIKNAVDAMPEGGDLTIQTESDTKNVTISFRDMGFGISLEDQKKLFLPLNTTKAKGMGFGLAICRRLVEAHGGRIHVESAVGMGATFKVELPLATEGSS
jgi:signal transduction histidine kinase